MARFEFNLEGVLRHRKNVERQRQRDLAAEQAKMRPLEQKLRELDESVRQATQEIRGQHLVGRLDLAYLAGHRRFIAATQRQAMSLAQKMALVQREIDAARKRLADAARERRIIEKLREREFTQWRAEMEKKESQENDEIGMQLALRTGVEERARAGGEA